MIKFIADVGSNFDGSLELAKFYIKICKKIGVDIVKFQCWDVNDLFSNYHPAYNKIKCSKKPLGLPLNWHKELIELAKREDITFSTTPTQPYHVEKLEEYGIEIYKISSGDITFYPLIDEINKTGKPVILSTGMSTICEIERAVDRLHNCSKIVILHCVSLYPTKYEEVNLRAIEVIRERFKDIDVGVSDHTEGVDVVLASVPYGISYIEKHITVDRGLGTPDAFFALTVTEFETMINKVRNVEKALGKREKGPVDREIPERYWARRGIYAKRDIKEGEPIDFDCLDFLRPQKGIPAEYFELVIGKVSKKDIKAGTPLTWELLEDGC